MKETTIPMKQQTLSLCMISDDFLPAATGVGTHVQLVSKELARLGHSVTVITTRRKGQPEFEVWNGVRVHRTFTVKLYGFHQALPSQATLRRLIVECAPDIIHYHYLGFLLKGARRIAASEGIRSVYTYHMTADHLTQPLMMRPFRSIIARQILDFCNTCDLVIAPSSNLAREIARDGVTSPTAYVSNPIAFDTQPDTAVAAEKRGFTVLFAGRLAPEKNVPYLLRAFSAFARRTPIARLLLAGEGSERRRLESLVRELGIADRVSFLGHLDRAALSKCYAAADVFVLPSLVECQPIVAMEAMHFSLPVLMSDRIVSARELVDDGQNGLLVNVDSENDLAEKLEKLSLAPALCRRMGRLGQVKAVSYRPESIVNQLVCHYRNVCESSVRIEHPAFVGNLGEAMS
ncbi:MAG: hypothetical protein C0404_11185 [Verrucomicrobia bacterium]|nr:hypothetical protein [Verrucomicrobiota bacterium]